MILDWSEAQFSPVITQATDVQSNRLFMQQTPDGDGDGRCLKTKPYLHTVMRFLRSTAMFLLDAFFDVKPIAIAVWTQAASIRWSLNASSREPPTPPFGPKHTKHTLHTPHTPTPTGQPQRFLTLLKWCSHRLPASHLTPALLLQLALCLHEFYLLFSKHQAKNTVLLCDF